jgi:hypothetical protein
VTLTDPAARRLHQHTGGLAIYVRMLLEELSQDQLNNLESVLAAPRSLASGAVAALAKLPPESRRLAWALAVLGTGRAFPALGSPDNFPAGRCRAAPAQVGEPAAGQPAARARRRHETRDPILPGDTASRPRARQPGLGPGRP